MRDNACGVTDVAQLLHVPLAPKAICIPKCAKSAATIIIYCHHYVLHKAKITLTGHLITSHSAIPLLDILSNYIIIYRTIPI